MEARLAAVTPPADPLKHLKYRPDIDGLRAVAVLAVVGFHALPTRLTGGFVGVDIFFVISGYLISSIIFQQVSAGRFSYLQFYARRAKRIFPALIAVLLASYAFGWFQLLGDEFALLAKHIQSNTHFLTASAQGAATVETSRQALTTQVPLTVAALSELTPSVLVFKSVPTLHENIRSGYVRHRDQFEPSLEEHQRLERSNAEILDKLVLMPGVQVLDPAALLCDKSCKAVSNGTLLYVDDNHVSAQGALLFEDVIRTSVH